MSGSEAARRPIRQFLDADLVDTLHVAVSSSVKLGAGSRLWESPDELDDPVPPRGGAQPQRRDASPVLEAMTPDIVGSMVTFAEPVPRTPWQDAHFIGGHPVLDLTNTVFHRSNPVQDNELLKSPADVLSWCRSVGLFKTAPPMADAAGRKLVADVHEVREHAWSVFNAVSRGEAVPTEDFGSLLERAGTGVRARHVSRIDATFEDWVADWKAAGAIPTALVDVGRARVVHAPARQDQGVRPVRLVVPRLVTGRAQALVQHDYLRQS